MTIVQKVPLRNIALLATMLVFVMGCQRAKTTNSSREQSEGYTVPDELANFVSSSANPLFSGTGGDTWDEKIRERGFILKEDDGYHLWYTGYREESKRERMSLGYATSPDGITWTRYAGNPIVTDQWIEDMMVVRHGDLYYMFAEGRDDVAHLLVSNDKINWNDRGALRITRTNGQPLSPGPYGTPTVYIEGDVWHLFYERNDEGIWHATSTDLVEWKNVSDEPVINKGPENYDFYGVALNQIIRDGEFYYGWYHGTPDKDWSEWNVNIAVSKDLHSWKKYAGNPIIKGNRSSGIVVHDGQRYRLYTMHGKVEVHLPKSGEPSKAK